MKRIGYVAAGALALFASSAFAVDHTVTASNFQFDPPTLTINVGDTVTFVNGGGFHNVLSDTDSVISFRCANGCDGDGGNGDPASNSWSATVLFSTAGTAPYHCEIHGVDGGGGMAGTITIVNGGTGPIIGVDPTSLTGTAASGDATSVPLAISNSGDADLNWTGDVASTDCVMPDSVPWLSLSPTSGTVMGGAPADNVDVTLDATLLAEGVYNANVCIHSNDTAADPVTVPVEFTVTTPDLIFRDGFDP